MIIIAGNTATNGIKCVEESAMCYGTLGVSRDLCRSAIAVETRTCFRNSWVWSVFSGGSQACKRPGSTTMRKDSDTREEKMELSSYPSVEGWNSRCRSRTQSFVFVVLLGLLELNSTVRLTLLILLLAGLFSHLYLKKIVIYIYIYLIHIFFKNPSHYHLTKNLRNRVIEN